MESYMRKGKKKVASILNGYYMSGTMLTFYLHDHVDLFCVGWFSKELYIETQVMKSPFQRPFNY